MVPVAAGLRDVLRYSLTYMTGSVAYKAVALLAIPVLARLLSPSELGLLDLAALISSIVSLTAGVGLDTAVARLQPSEGAGRLWTTAAGTLFVAAAVSVVVGLGAAGFLAAWLMGSASHTGLVAAAVVYGVVLAGVGFALTFVRLTDRPGVYARYAFLLVLAQMGVGIAIASVVSQPITAMVWGWTAASLVGLGFLFWRERMPKGGFDRALATRLARFGAPLVPAAVVWILGDLGIRAVIANESTLEALGSYSVAARIVSVMGLFVAAFALAWHPYVFRLSRDRVAGETQRAMIQLIGGMGIIAILISSIAREGVLIVAGPAYGQAVGAVPAMAGSMVVLGVLTLLSGVIALERGTATVAVSSGLGALVQVAAAFLFVPSAGLAGGAVATAAGYTAATVVLLQSARFLGMRAVSAAFVLISAASVITSLVLLQVVSEAPLLLRAATAGVACGVLAGICYLALARLPHRELAPG